MNNVLKARFVGFEEVNSPRELLVTKCLKALEEAKSLGIEIMATEIVTDDTEGWTNFRRTGYPKLFPVTPSQNHSNGTINTEIQIRRAPYPTSEYANKQAEVMKGIQLFGGPDNGSTRVWWDVNVPNF